MIRDLTPPQRPDLRPERIRPDTARPETSAASRERELVELRGYRYRLSQAELETLHDIGRFRTVEVADLSRFRYGANTRLMQHDLYSLRDQGLVQLRMARSGPKTKKLPVVVLTKLGKALLEKEYKLAPGQAVYAKFVKPSEVRHDAAIYRMYQAEKAKIERAGGRVRRIVLDYELKKKVYSPLAKAKALPPLDYAKRQEEVARENGLKVIAGKIPLPDLRVEYETANGAAARVDLELTTGHYHGPALAEKAQAGFKMYAADGSGSRLGRVLEERDIVAEILSL